MGQGDCRHCCSSGSKICDLEASQVPAEEVLLVAMSPVTSMMRREEGHLQKKKCKRHKENLDSHRKKYFMDIRLFLASDIHPLRHWLF